MSILPSTPTFMHTRYTLDHMLIGLATHIGIRMHYRLTYKISFQCIHFTYFTDYAKLFSSKPATAAYTLHIYIYIKFTHQRHTYLTPTYSWKMFGWKCVVYDWMWTALWLAMWFSWSNSTLYFKNTSAKSGCCMLYVYKTSCSLPSKHQLLSRVFVWAEENVNCCNPRIHCTCTCEFVFWMNQWPI